jgi:hypothetical protein
MARPCHPKTALFEPRPYKTVRIDKSVPEIRQAIFNYEANCRAFESVKVDPSGAKRITLTRTALEVARDTIYMRVDITADDSSATFKRFNYHNDSGWHKRADEVLGAINDRRRAILRTD